MPDLDQLLKQIDELRSSVLEIKEGKSLKDLGIIVESQILDIILNNYRESLIKIIS